LKLNGFRAFLVFKLKMSFIIYPYIYPYGVQ